MFKFNKKIQKNRVLVYLIVGIIIAMVIDVAILNAINKRNSNRVTQVMLNQVIALMEQKEDMTDVVDSMLIYEGFNVYVADAASGKICASTDTERIGKHLRGLGFDLVKADGNDSFKQILNVDGFRQFTRCTHYKDYYVAVAYSTRANLGGFVISLVIELVYVLVAAAIIWIIINKMIESDKETDSQLSVLVSMSDIYYSMHLIDLELNSVKEYRARDKVKEIVDHEFGADEMMRQIMTATTDNAYLKPVLAFTDLNTLADRMQDKKIISLEFVGTQFGWCEASFISIESNFLGKPRKVLYVTRDIDETKKKEETLIFKSNTDELTGFYNRRAYEDDVNDYDYNYVRDDFVYISFDLNGLKTINDTLGHNAGDEIIVGAAECIKKIFEPYGKVYRIGGDEFVAMINIKPDKLTTVLEEFETLVDNWTGTIVDKMSISYGCIKKYENKGTKVSKMAIAADKKMYEAKSEYYRKSGVDRRGRKEAHIVLCELYTKILKINITQDTYQIIDMDEDEQTIEKGFADTISGWLSNFGTSGQVHPDDLDEYLRMTDSKYMSDYFKNKKSSLSVFYRRKYGDNYKLVMMEIVPAGDYADDNQNLFLYVKNIDK